MADMTHIHSEIVLILADVPIKFRQVLLPLLTGTFERSMEMLARMRTETKAALPVSDANLVVCRWQFVFEQLMHGRIVKEVRLAPVVEKLERMRRRLVKRQGG